MEIYLIITVLFIGLILGFNIWIIRLVRLYKKGKRTSFAIQVFILTGIIIYITWQLQIFPLSKNFYFQDRTTLLTGKKFWSWKEYNYEDLSVRGEGYTLDIYRFNAETADYFKNPDVEFYNNFPSENFSDVRWSKTPIKENEKNILEFVTPLYAGWKDEIVEKQDFIREIANKPGSFYAYQHSGSTNFYLIVPSKRLVILINHSM